MRFSSATTIQDESSLIRIPRWTLGLAQASQEKRVAINAKELEFWTIWWKREMRDGTWLVLKLSMLSGRQQMRSLIVSLMFISGTAEKLDLDCILTVHNVGYKLGEWKRTGLFTKIPIYTFSIFSVLVICLHLAIYFLFPSTYHRPSSETIGQSDSHCQSWGPRKKIGRILSKNA